MKRFYAAGLGLGLALALVPAGAAHAQTGIARGKVVDEQGKPVPDATVVIEAQGGVTRKFQVKTNKKGEYAQVGLSSGNYRFTGSKEGLQSFYTEQRVSIGDPTEIGDIILKPLPKGVVGGGDAKAAQELQAAFKKAVELTDQAKYDEAEVAYQEILTKTPDIAQVHYNLGFVYAQKKDWPKAETSYKKALELKPDLNDASVGLARVYMESGQQEKAMEIMQAGAASDPKMQFNVGIMMLNAGKYPEAEEAFKKAEAADPNNPEVQFHLGTILIGQGKTPEAIARLEKYLSMSPTNTQNVSTAQQLVVALKPKK